MFEIPKLHHTQSGNFFLMAGPCAIEGEEMALQIAERLKLDVKTVEENVKKSLFI